MPVKAAPFETKYIPEPNSGCWLWIAGRAGSGYSADYGSVRYRGRMMGAHRASWLIHRSEIPLGLCVLHRCDTPACVNPDHLFLGTQGDNSRDRERKGRSRANFQSGEANPIAKLTNIDVRAIRVDTRIYQVIAQNYGVTSEAIRMIKNRQRWAHL